MTNTTSTATTLPTKGSDLKIDQTILVGVGHVSRCRILDIVGQVAPRPRGIDGRPLDKDSLERLSHLTRRATVIDERGRISDLPIHRVREYTVVSD